MCLRREHRLLWSRDAPANARATLTDELAGLLGRSGQARRVVEDAELVVSELVTNAISARCTEVVITLTAHADRIEISVWDDGNGVPVTRAAGMFDTSGRGLIIVAAVASQWGVEPGSDGSKRVWARLSVSRSLTGTIPCQEPVLAD